MPKKPFSAKCLLPPSPPSPPFPPFPYPPCLFPSSPPSTASPPFPDYASPPYTSSSSPSSSSSAPSSSSSPLSKIPSIAFVGIALAGVIAVAIVLTLLICLTKKTRTKKTIFFSGNRHGPRPVAAGHVEQLERWSGSSEVGKMPAPPPPPPFPLSESFFPAAGTSIRIKSPPTETLSAANSTFSYDELQAATDNFAGNNLLGEGGFGCVYKGVLPGGRHVAVKQLKVGGRQGEREFRAEVEIISRVHHRHLVSLVGYCISDKERLLVYDFVPNGTLELHLHGKDRPVMDWKTRLKIAIGAARGLAYLHEDCHPRIIHRDIKSSNILLDHNFEAQVSDFGLAKLTSDSSTYVMTRVMGTFGYLAPEYASSGKLTEKSDVFSFGVVLLELVTGKRHVDPNGEESLVEWARPVLIQVLESGGGLELLVDPGLNGDFEENEMMHMIEAAAACIRQSADKRPRMGQVVRALEDDANILSVHKGVRPSIYVPPYESTDYETTAKRFRRVVQEVGTECSAQTISEDGPNPSASSSGYDTSREGEHRHMGKSSSTKPSTGVKAGGVISTSSSNDHLSSQEREKSHSI